MSLSVCSVSSGKAFGLAGLRLMTSMDLLASEEQDDDSEEKTETASLKESSEEEGCSTRMCA